MTVDPDLTVPIARRPSRVRLLDPTSPAGAAGAAHDPRLDAVLKVVTDSGDDGIGFNAVVAAAGVYKGLAKKLLAELVDAGEVSVVSVPGRGGTTSVYRAG